MMYLKIYYVRDGGRLRDATIADVQAALPADMPGLEVDEIAGSCTIVEFPEGATHEDSRKLAKHLQRQGFETE